MHVIIQIDCDKYFEYNSCFKQKLDPHFYAFLEFFSILEVIIKFIINVKYITGDNILNIIFSNTKNSTKNETFKEIKRYICVLILAFF